MCCSRSGRGIGGRSILCAASVLTLTAWAPVHLVAQVPRLDFGTRVRVVAPPVVDGRLTGTVIRVDTYSVLLDAARGSPRPLVIPFEAIESLEVSLGERSNTWKGLGFGALGGALLGAGLMGVACAVEGGCESDGASASGWMAFGFVVGAGVGAGVGMIVGSLVRTETWATLDPSRLSTGVL